MANPLATSSEIISCQAVERQSRLWYPEILIAHSFIIHSWKVFSVKSVWLGIGNAYVLIGWGMLHGWGVDFREGIRLIEVLSGPRWAAAIESQMPIADWRPPKVRKVGTFRLSGKVIFSFPNKTHPSWPIAFAFAIAVCPFTLSRKGVRHA